MDAGIQVSGGGQRARRQPMPVASLANDNGAIGDPRPRRLDYLRTVTFVTDTFTNRS